VHTEIEVIVPSSRTDELIDDLQQMDDVVSLSVVREVSIKPPGDVFTVHALNRGADEVLRLANAAREEGQVSVSTAGSGGLDRKTGAPGRWYQRCLGERRAARGQRQGCDDTREIRGTGRGCVCLLSLEQRAGDSETRRRGDGETEVTAAHG
jgi:hypothetical protein